MNSFLHTFSPIKQLIFLILSIFTSWFIFSIVGGIMGIILFDVNILTNPQALFLNTYFLKFFQAIQSISIFIIPSLFVAKLCHFKPWEWLKLKKHTPFSIIVVSVLIALLSQPIISFTGILNNQLALPSFMESIEVWMRSKENEAMELTIKFLSSNSVLETILSAIIISVLPAIGEELLFRGVLQNLFSKLFKNVHVSILLTAILFSAIHIQFFGFLPRMLLGLLFGYLVYYYKNLWPAIIAHFTNNFLAFSIYYFADNSDKTSVISPDSEYPNVFYVIGFAVASIALLRIAFLHGKKFEENSTKSY